MAHVRPISEEYPSTNINFTVQTVLACLSECSNTYRLQVSSCVCHKTLDAVKGSSARYTGEIGKHCSKVANIAKWLSSRSSNAKGLGQDGHIQKSPRELGLSQRMHLMEPSIERLDQAGSTGAPHVPMLKRISKKGSWSKITPRSTLHQSFIATTLPLIPSAIHQSQQRSTDQFTSSGNVTSRHIVPAN